MEEGQHSIAKAHKLVALELFKVAIKTNLKNENGLEIQ